MSLKNGLIVPAQHAMITECTLEVDHKREQTKRGKA